MPIISTGEATPPKQYHNEITAHTIIQFKLIYLNARHAYINIRQYIKLSIIATVQSNGEKSQGEPFPTAMYMETLP